MLCRLIRYLCIYTARMSPALNGNPALQHFECDNVIGICNGIIISTPHCHIYMHMWQSRVKSQIISLRIFNHIVAFEAPYC